MDENNNNIYRYKYENGEMREDTDSSSATGNTNTYEDTYNRDDAYRSYNYGSYSYGDYSDNTGSYSQSNYGASAQTYPAPKKKNPFLKAARFLAAAACFGVIAGAAFFGVNYLADELLGTDESIVINQSAENGTANGSYLSDSGITNLTIATTEHNNVAEDTGDSIVVQVVEENMAATVAVKSTFTKNYYYFGQYYQKESQGSGSGFIVGINDTELLIATNNHVISDATKIEVTFADDTTLEATVKGTDSIADLAIIAVPLSTIADETMSKIRIATLGNSDEVKVGEMAIAIGNALGYGQSVTVGYISAKDREVTVDGNTMVLLQTDAAINGGNSGGPLLNTKGEVIGINSVKYADTSVEGMCFAIPISRAIPILNELMNRETLTEEEQGYLGIEPKTVTDEIASFYGWPTGVYVSRVLENSAAEAAGLYIGDIITSINGVQVITAEQLKSAVTSYRYGTTLELIVQRNVNGKFEEITLSVTLMKNPNLK
ncbi:MAG: S1C family serine protease [Lachnospiraceae bacterium]